ncbi:CBS domain-containing protein [Fodinisporobacter ferrooxydans]|uniref:CBS domain-containing protein n=1 Tax=Fodinisporobacter ferrooxydans TaxID=2901836 RepID=A0ABY4CMR4_9BACL|nr:CBS domain-containing protein [Alicyclobacillaceae bacterium MYW30-H2]
MKNLQNGFMFEHEIKELIIPSDNVAHVQLGNTLEHALLVLIKSGYSAIPVLDHTYKLHGLVSKTMILDSILGMEQIEYERLGSHKVEEVMNPKVPRMKESDTFTRAMELSINNPFICIENEGIFTGIITRRSILALVYRYFRQQQ